MAQQALCSTVHTLSSRAKVSHAACALTALQKLKRMESVALSFVMANCAASLVDAFTSCSSAPAAPQTNVIWWKAFLQV